MPIGSVLKVRFEVLFSNPHFGFGSIPILQQTPASGSHALAQAARPLPTAWIAWPQ